MLDFLLTSTLPLLVLRGIFEKIRFWRFEIDDAFCMMTSSSYNKKRSFFYHWYHVNRYTYVLKRSVSMVNGFTLNCRHIFNHSVKEHPYCSRYLINTQGWVAQSMVSFNHWLSSIKTNTLSRYLTPVNANHASSNWALVANWIFFPVSFI